MEATIKDNRIVIFSKTTCPWCVKAKELIASLSSVDIHTVQLDVVGKKSFSKFNIRNQIFITNVIFLKKIMVPR